MRMRSLASLAVPSLFILSIATIARGAEPLTLEGALAIARERAPSIVAERMRLEESRARAAQQQRAFTSDPELEAAVGRREHPDAVDSTQDWEVAIYQSLGDLVRASARGDAAGATLDADTRAEQDFERIVLLEVATAFAEHVALERRHALAGDSLETATRLHDAALRRFEAGDVAQLDVNLSRAMLARVTAEKSSASAELDVSRARLSALLGSGDASSLDVSDDLTLPAATQDLDLAASIAARSDVRRLDAEITATQSELRLAAPLRALDWGLVASVAEDDGDRITSAGLRVGLPVTGRAQYARAESSARLARLEHERAALVLSATSTLVAAANAYARLRESATAMTGSILPLLAENDALALESYDGGQIGIAELAAVRRESTDARNAAITHWLEARLAGLRLRFLSGDLR